MFAPFRFLHSSDWHLERPIVGLGEVPDHLREILVEGPYRAATGVVETAIDQKVDFVVLAGDLLDPRLTGPRGIAFVLEQFERLGQAGVAVYWATGAADAEANWPRQIALPANVRRFSQRQAAAEICRRHGQPVARIVGRGGDRSAAIPADQFAGDAELHTVAVVSGRADADRLRAMPIDFWALGGRPNRASLFSGSRTAQYSGSPQGRGFQETGPHGCTLVEIGAEGGATCRFVSCDCLRWHIEPLQLESPPHEAELERSVHQRMAELDQRWVGMGLLIHWKVITPTGASAALRRQAGLLLKALRDHYGSRTPVRWSSAIEFQCSESGKQWHGEQDNLLGDFLREARQYQYDSGQTIDLTPLVSPRRRESSLKKHLTLADGAQRRRVLREVEELGIELFGQPARGAQS